MSKLVIEQGGKAQYMVLKGKNHAGANDEIGLPGDSTGDLLVRLIRDAGSL